MSQRPTRRNPILDAFRRDRYLAHWISMLRVATTDPGADGVAAVIRDAPRPVRLHALHVLERLQRMRRRSLFP